MRLEIDYDPTTERENMQITFEGTPEQVRQEVFEFFGLEIQEQQTAPIAANSPARSPGRPRKQAAPPPTDASAPPPAPPAAAEPAPTRSMMPMCKKHAADAPAGIKPIPAEESACTPCINDKTIAQTKAIAAGKAMSLHEAKAVAEGLIAALGGDDGNGVNVCCDILEAMGAESLTGAQDTKALDPAKYEEFAKRCLAAMPPPPAATNPAPVRRSL
jgi:hypothetical protein